MEWMRAAIDFAGTGVILDATRRRHRRPPYFNRHAWKETADDGMKARVERALVEAAARLVREGFLPEVAAPIVEPAKEESFGDFTTNMAMVCASRIRVPPRALAERIVAALGDAGGLFERVEVAGPGFINIFVSRANWLADLAAASRMGSSWGNSNVGGGRRIQVEFVSANPTGPLHVGHGRGAAVGDVLANLLAAAGWKVEREYYINDSGRQMSLLGKSVLARYRQTLGKDAKLPEDGYKGDYIHDIARDLILKKGETLVAMDEGEAAATATSFAVDWIMAGIRKDLADFGVTFDAWVSEKRLLEEHPLGELLDELRARGEAFSADDALWLRTTAHDDDKDRVLLRSNGQATYFANDILYHRDKFRRGFDRVIDIWGADHHGYVNRMRAAIQTLGKPADSLSVILIQLVRLLRGGEPVAMSTRAGEFDTLRQVVDEVGRDAARFFFLTRKADAQLDFDLELAKHRSSDNPVYYVQYAHARIRSIFRKLPEGVERAVASPDLALLVHPEEMALIKQVALYPDVVAQAALVLEPHRIPFFLQDLASRFHLYYNRHRVISADEALSGARLFLLDMVGRVIAHGLGIVGVSAPESM